MATAQDYPITTAYGKVAGYPLNNGFHKGEDRAMPTGTPVLVNGVQIGLSGTTGASTGPHLHIGRFVGAQDTPPSGGGFTVSNAKVLQTGSDASNGNFVRVADADGSTWVYLHLSRIDVKPGQVLIKSKEEVVAKPSPAEVRSAAKTYGQVFTEAQVAYYADRSWEVLLNDLLPAVNDMRLAAEALANKEVAVLAPGIYRVK